MPNVYIITQDITNLHGFYLTKAVVGAQTQAKAITALRRHFEEQDEELVPIVENERLTVREVGRATERFVVAETGQDDL